MPVYLRARDVRSLIKEHGFERGITEAIERVCDENAGHRQALVDMAGQLNAVMELLSKFTVIGENMSKRIQEIDRREQQYQSAAEGGITVSSTSNDG